MSSLLFSYAIFKVLLTLTLLFSNVNEEKTTVGPTQCAPNFYDRRK